MSLRPLIYVRQLGNGRALNPSITNTAFTLFDDKILVDCGYNVFQKLLNTKDENNTKISDKIEYVFITHIHDDHIGSLMSFLYYREFVLQKPIKVFVPQSVYQILKLQDKKFEYPNNFVDLEYVKIKSLNNELNKINTLVLSNLEYNKSRNDVRVYYMTVDSHGYVDNTVYKFRMPIFDGYGKRINYVDIHVVITGDTKANILIKKIALKHIHKDDKLIVFHDYSYFNSPNSIHACEYDFESIYDEQFKKYIVKVHTGDTEFKEVYLSEDILGVK